MMSTFQIAIAVGAIAGGLLVDHLGAAGAIGYCALAALASGLTIFTLGRASER